jgi:adenosylmethionine-8-amino-7-oxononanoate aminotransferase
LRSLLDDGLVADVRGVGALWAVSVLEGTDPVSTRDRMLELGVVVRPIAPATLAVCPPLVIEPADLDAIPNALRAALS